MLAEGLGVWGSRPLPGFAAPCNPLIKYLDPKTYVTHSSSYCFECFLGWGPDLSAMNHEPFLFMTPPSLTPIMARDEFCLALRALLAAVFTLIGLLDCLVAAAWSQFLGAVLSFERLARWFVDDGIVQPAVQLYEVTHKSPARESDSNYR